MKFTTYKLPAYWASALINADRSGLSDDDEKELDKFCNKHKEKIGSCVGIVVTGKHKYRDSKGRFRSEELYEPWFSWRNDATILGGDVLEFIFEDLTLQLS